MSIENQHGAKEGRKTREAVDHQIGQFLAPRRPREIQPAKLLKPGSQFVFRLMAEIGGWYFQPLERSRAEQDTSRSFHLEELDRENVSGPFQLFHRKDNGWRLA